MIKYKRSIMHNYLSGDIDDKTLYIVKDEYLQQPNNTTKISMGTLNGYNIIIPKNDNISFNRTIIYDYYFNSKNVQFIGWSGEEREHRWSLGNNTKIIFNILEPNKLKGMLQIAFGTLGEQNTIILLNGNPISKAKVKGWKLVGNINFNKNLLNIGTNTLEFYFSNPHKPSNNDNRDLAFALRNFKIR